MQTFSNMRRNSSYSQNLKNIFLLLGFFVYESLASMFVYLPPLLGVLFLLFRHYDQKEDFWRFCIILVIMFVVEIFYNMPLWLLFVLFVIQRYVVIMWLTHFNIKYVIHIAQVILTYVSLYAVLVCIGFVTHATLAINPVVLIYYCLFEIILVSIYEYTI